MAFEENTPFTMPVAPMYGNGGGMGFGGDWGWIILLLVLCGGWGGMGGFGGGMWPMMMMGGMDGFGLYPWLNNSQNINGGFRDQMLNTSVASIGDKVTSGFGDVATQLCGGFAGVTAAVNGAQNAVAQQLYTNQISDLERSFAAQTASTQGMSAIQAQLAQCCCDNRAATADLKYTVASEECNTRNAVISAVNAGVQSIKDQIFQDKLDAKNDEIAQLRQENLYARGQASQITQNAAIINGVYDRLSQCPVDTTPVFGRQPIWTCAQNVASNGCGCGA